MEPETQPTVTATSRFEATKQKVSGLLALKNITLKDIEDLSQIEREYLAETSNQQLQALTGTQRDEFLQKIELIMTPASNVDVWACNHSEISNAVSEYMEKYGSMPPQHIIAQKTGLSRQTVAKHLATYKKRPEFAAQMDQFQFAAPKLLANVYKQALKGDTKAARLYFEMIGAPNLQASNAAVNAQNNYIQINNTILSQDNLKQLTAAQLNQIESIVNGRRG